LKAFPGLTVKDLRITRLPFDPIRIGRCNKEVKEELGEMGADVFAVLDGTFKVQR